MEKEGRQTRHIDGDGIDDESFIKGTDVAYSAWRGQTANAGGIVVVVSRAAAVLQVCTNSKTTCSLLALWFADAHCYSQESQLALFCLFLSVFIITFFSFMLPMFSLLAACLDKCVYDISRLLQKPMHKPLSKINKKESWEGWGKNEGQERKNTEPEPYVMLERPLRTLSIFPSIFSVQACIRRH